MGLIGSAAAALFIVVFTVDGWRRPGYRPLYHPVSALALGRRGWVQTTNFLVGGAGFLVGAAGLWAEFPWIAAAVAVLGLALAASGVWAMDPMRGYPPGTPSSTPERYSRAHRWHDNTGALLFLGLPVTAVLTAVIGPDGWLRWYSVATALASGLLFARFGIGWEADDARTGLWQRLTIVVGWTWLAVLFAAA
ncbi:DUF998 domain-containing protein [Jiangella alba]|uniref:DUF998 domain-containing protein n=1 Tax=Jiangella alba TaxID=561176 RepID=A0A1H5PA27_9ACTN|nr:DUF998 domain-containing protein [Jiangella alba]SEF10560.1 Protein of unknown function [Jiangella alba]